MNSINVSVLIINLLMICGINSKSFCDDRRIDTAFTFESQVFLIRNNTVWSFDSQNKTVSYESIPLKDFIDNNQIKSIDAVFLFTNDSKNFLYVFEENKYHLLKDIKSDENVFGLHFSPLSRFDENYVPQNWSTYGGVIHDWFPPNIDEAIVLFKEEVYLFHGSSVRYTKISNDWPKGEKNELQFEGPLKNLSKIDAIFRLSSVDMNREDIVIVEGLNYCSFSTNLLDLNINTEIVKSCVWKDSSLYFTCEMKSTQTLIISTETTNSTETPSETSETNAMDTQSTHEIQVSTHDTQNEKSNILVIIMITIISFVFIGFIIGVIVCILRAKKRESKKSIEPKNEFSAFLDHDRSSSIVTIDSDTGQTIRSLSSHQTS